MSVGFLAAQNIAETIRARQETGDIGPAQHFSSWLDGHQCNYYEVPADMEPDIDQFWGYCAELNVYFISQNVKHAIKTAILQMEEYRIKQSKPHAEAVAFAVSQPLKYRLLFIETLLRFYLAKKDSLSEAIPDLDINSAVEFLQQCPR